MGTTIKTGTAYYWFGTFEKSDSILFKGMVPSVWSAKLLELLSFDTRILSVCHDYHGPPPCVMTSALAGALRWWKIRLRWVALRSALRSNTLCSHYRKGAQIDEDLTMIVPSRTFFWNKIYLPYISQKCFFGDQNNGNLQLKKRGSQGAVY